MSNNLYMISGWRGITRENEIRDILISLPKNATIIVGDAAGADRIATSYARRLGLAVKIMKPRWKTVENAGLKRNWDMINHRPCKLFAFCPRGHVTRGTGHAISCAKKMCIPHEVISVNQEYRDISKKGVPASKKVNTIRRYLTSPSASV